MNGHCKIVATPPSLLCVRDCDHTLQEVKPLKKVVQALLSHAGTLLLPLQDSEPAVEWGVGGSEAPALSSLWESSKVGAITSSCVKPTIMSRDTSAAPASF